MAHSLEVLIQTRRGLKRRVGGSVCGINVAAVGQCNTEAHPADRFEKFVVLRVALGDHTPESGDGPFHIAFHQLHPREAHPAHPRVGPVTNRVGEIATFFAGLRLHRSSSFRAKTLASE